MTVTISVTGYLSPEWKEERTISSDQLISYVVLAAAWPSQTDVKIFPAATNIIVATKTQTRTQMYRNWTKQTFALWYLEGEQPQATATSPVFLQSQGCRDGTWQRQRPFSLTGMRRWRRLSKYCWSWSIYPLIWESMDEHWTLPPSYLTPGSSN